MNPMILRSILLAALVQSALAADEGGVVQKWLAGQAEIKTLTADFVQERCLREGKRPIVSEGKFSFAAPGSFRWQMGKPAVTLAVQKKDGDLVVANVRRKKAKVYPQKVLEQEQSAMGFSFIEAGFPKSLAEFEKNFSVKEIETVDGIHHVTVTINDRRTSVGLRKMIFLIAEDSHELRGFYLRFRDSSSITTRFSGVKKNPGVPQDEFKLDLSSYETTVHGKK